MVKYIFSSICLMLSLGLSAQQTLEDINKDVWYNFMQAYQDLDASLFNQIHTEDVIRVPIDGNIMLIGQEYKDQNLDNFNRWNQAQLKQKIEFSFNSRIQKGNWAHESGIYKLTRFSDSGVESYYGKFNVTLKKIKGFWKIFIDSDSNENGKIGEADFEKGDILK
ncbi:MAG TPA: hypothetical protein VIN11_07160 [Roseivirga sp.]